MITNNHANAALQLYSEVRRMGLEVRAKPGSPLERLHQSIPFVTPQSDGDITPELLSASSTHFGDPAASSLPSLHTVDLVTMAEQAGKMCIPHLRLARTVVNPMIREVAEAYSKNLASYIQEPVSVVLKVYCLPEPLTQGLGEELTQTYTNGPEADTPVDLDLPINSPEELTQLMMTGVPEVDAPVRAWLATLDRGTMELAVNWNFRGSARPKCILGRDQSVDIDLIAYLLAKRLIDSPPLEGVSVSLGNYKSRLQSLVNESGSRLAAAVTAYNAQLATGVLVRSCTDNLVVVLGKNYEVFKEQGGLDHLLYANARLPNPMVRVQEILDRSSELSARWERLSNVYRSLESGTRLVAMRGMLMEATNTVLNEHFEEMYAHLNPGQKINRQAAEIIVGTRVAHAIISNATVKDFDNVMGLCMKVVAAGLFNHTAAYDLLKGIEEAMQENPDLSPMEASALAQYGYVASFLVGQIEFVPAKA